MKVGKRIVMVDSLIGTVIYATNMMPECIPHGITEEEKQKRIDAYEIKRQEQAKEYGELDD